MNDDFVVYVKIPVRVSPEELAALKENLFGEVPLTEGALHDYAKRHISDQAVEHMAKTFKLAGTKPAHKPHAAKPAEVK